MSHYMVNNGMPIMHTLNTLYGYDQWEHKDRHLLAVNSNGRHFASDMLHFSHVYESLGSDSYLSDGPVCYSRVIIGLGNYCDCCGCENELPDKRVYAQLMDRVRRHYLSTADYLLSKAYDNKIVRKAPFVVIVERLNSRHILNLPELTKFLESRRIKSKIVHLEQMDFASQVSSYP